MSATANNHKEFAKETSAISLMVKRLAYRLRKYIDTNSHNGLDWTTPPDGVEVNGVVSGVEFTKAEQSNTIGSAQGLLDYLTGAYADNNRPAPANHLGNFNKTAPIIDPQE